MNRKNLTAAVLAGLTGVAGLAGSAQAGIGLENVAVNLNPDGLGEVLLYPYYTSNDGNQTLLTVVNTTDYAKAVKVRFLEGYNSREVLDFNLYLSPWDVWVAAIADGGDLGFASQAGVPHLVVPDTSCTVPYLYGNGIEAGLDFGLQSFLPFAYSGANNDSGPDEEASYDMLGNIIAPIPRASEGYVEMIEMGQMTGGDGVTKDQFAAVVGPHDARMDSATAVTHVIKEDEDGHEYVEPADCELLVENWTEYVGNVTPPHPLSGWWLNNATLDAKCDLGPAATEQDLLDAGCGQQDDGMIDFGGATGVVDTGLTSVGMNEGGLFGGGAIVNAEAGTMFSYDAKAVQGFDNTQDGVHFYPGTIHPSLNDGNVKYAWVNVAGGYNYPANFSTDRSVDAVSAVFMHDQLANTFVLSESIGAKTEWVMTLPTKAWYVDDTLNNTASIYYTPDPADTGCNGWDANEPNPYIPPVYTAGSGDGGGWLPGDPIPDGTNTTPATGEDWSTCTPLKNTDTEAVAPFTGLFQGGKACEDVTFRAWDREESPTIEGGDIIPPIVSPAPPGQPGTEETPFQLCYEVNVLRFGDGSIFGTESDLLYTVTGTADKGWARITMQDNEYEDSDANVLVGLPIIGFSAEALVNDNVQGGVLANYGGLFNHKGSTCIIPGQAPDDFDCDSSLNIID